MTAGGPPSAYELLLARDNAARPFVTHYGPGGARTELSVASCANGVAKAAGLLRDGLGVAPGAVVSIDLPRHWQLAVWVLGALSVGARCGRAVPGQVDVRLVGPAGLAALAAGVDLRADEVLASSCDALGMPVPGGVPDGVLDVALEARLHPDVFSVEPQAAAAAALDGGSGEVAWSSLVADPAARAAPVGARLWVDERVPDARLLHVAGVLPLLLRGSVVLADGLDPARAERVRAVEAVTHDAADLLG